MPLRLVQIEYSLNAIVQIRVHGHESRRNVLMYRAFAYRKNARNGTHRATSFDYVLGQYLAPLLLALLIHSVPSRFISAFTTLYERKGLIHDERIGEIFGFLAS